MVERIDKVESPGELPCPIGELYKKPPRERSAGRAGLPMAFGKWVATAGNVVTLTPCMPDGFAIGADNVDVWASMPTGGTPTLPTWTTDNVLAYIPTPISGKAGLLITVAGGLMLGRQYSAMAYTSGPTILLTPCDASGTSTGAVNVTVQAGWTLPANTEIPTPAIIPFQQAANGNYYVIGQPREVMTNFQYDTTAHKLQKKVRMDFGAFSTTESSAWVDVTTAIKCRTS